MELCFDRHGSVEVELAGLTFSVGFVNVLVSMDSTIRSPALCPRTEMK